MSKTGRTDIDLKLYEDSKKLQYDLMKRLNQFLEAHENDNIHQVYAASMESFAKFYLMLCKFFGVTDMPQTLNLFKKVVLDMDKEFQPTFDRITKAH